MRKNKLSTLLIGVTVVAILAALPFIAGCAPEEGAPTPEEGAPPEEEVPEEAEPIKIGVPEKITGPYAGDGTLGLQAITMAVEEINAAGGVLGRKLEINAFDIEDILAEKLIASAEELVVKRKVDMVITGWAGAVGVETYGEYDIPYLHYNAEHTGWEYVLENPDFWNCFLLGPTEVDYAEPMVDVTMMFPWGFPNKRLAILHAEWEWERLYTRACAEYATEEYGWELVLDEKVPCGTTAFRPIMARVREAEPSLLIYSDLSAPDTWNFFREFIKQPTNTLLNFGYVLGYREWIELAGEEGNGIIGFGSSTPRRTERGLEFAARFKKRWGHESITTVVAPVYDGVYMWADAVEHVGDVTDYRAICKYIEDHDYVGINGRYDYKEGHRLFFSDDFPMPSVQVQNGRTVEIYYQRTPVPENEWILPPWLEQFR